MTLLLKDAPETFNIPKSNSVKNYTINHAIFFMTYPFFKEFDFFYWNDVEELHIKDMTISKALDYVINSRKEKSVQKALYDNYKKQLQNKNFRYLFIHLIIQKIVDPTLLTRALSSELCYFDFSAEDIEVIKQLLYFLRKYYTEEQIVIMMEAIDEDLIDSLFLDILTYFRDTEGSLEEFEPVACDLFNLHSEFIRCFEKF